MDILIVDDSKMVKKIITKYLDEEGITYDSASDGLEGFDILTNKKDFKLILLDWEMPKCNGIEFLEKIKGINNEVPVVMMTTKNKPEDIQMAMGLGAVDYLMKPFLKDILIERINKYMKG